MKYIMNLKIEAEDAFEKVYEVQKNFLLSKGIENFEEGTTYSQSLRTKLSAGVITSKVTVIEMKKNERIKFEIQTATVTIYQEYLFIPAEIGSTVIYKEFSKYSNSMKKINDNLMKVVWYFLLKRALKKRLSILFKEEGQ